MADYLIQQQEHIVNFIDITGGANKLIFTAGRSSVAQPSAVGLIEQLKVYDQTGQQYGYQISVTGNNISTQLNGGSVTPFAGTYRELLDLVNNSFFDDAVATTGGVTPTVPSKLDIFAGSLVDLENPDSGTWTGFTFDVENINVVGLDLNVLYEGVTQEVTNTRDLVDLLNTTQQAFTFTVLDDTQIGVWGNERPISDFIRVAFFDATNQEDVEYNKNIVTASATATTEQELHKQLELTRHLALIDSVGVDSTETTFTPAGASVTTVINANKYRKELIVINTTNKILYVKYGIGATSGSYSLPVLSNGDAVIIDKYKGVVSLTVSNTTSITGNVLITETV